MPLMVAHGRQGDDKARESAPQPMAANPEDIELDEMDEDEDGEGEGGPHIVLETKAVPVPLLPIISHLGCSSLCITLQHRCHWTF